MEFGGKRYIVHRLARQDWIKIWNFADIHMMNRGCHLKLLRKQIKEVAEDPYSFWFGGGDYVDYVAPGDKRFDPSIFPDYVRVSDLKSFGSYCVETIAKGFSPISHKCLGLLYGNHEDKYQIGKSQENLHDDLCQSLDVPNLGYSAFVDICLYSSSQCDEPVLMSPGLTFSDVKQHYQQGDSRTYRFFLHHGVGYATTRAGKMRKLADIMRMIDADVYMVGHVHDKIPNREIRIGANFSCTDFVEEVRYGLVTGGFLKTYVKGVTTYGEKRMYWPTYLGAANIMLMNQPRDMFTIY